MESEWPTEDELAETCAAMTARAIARVVGGNAPPYVTAGRYEGGDYTDERGEIRRLEVERSRVARELDELTRRRALIQRDLEGQENALRLLGAVKAERDTLNSELVRLSMDVSAQRLSLAERRNYESTRLRLNDLELAYRERGDELSRVRTEYIELANRFAEFCKRHRPQCCGCHK